MASDVQVSVAGFRSRTHLSAISTGIRGLRTAAPAPGVKSQRRLLPIPPDQHHDGARRSAPIACRSIEHPPGDLRMGEFDDVRVLVLVSVRTMLVVLLGVLPLIPAGYLWPRSRTSSSAMTMGPDKCRSCRRSRSATRSKRSSAAAGRRSRSGEVELHAGQPTGEPLPGPG